jgi:flagellar basal body rod protein FlgG
MYAAATGLDAAAQNHDIIAQNLAHIDVPGYRRLGMNFETFDRLLGSSSPEIETGNILGTRRNESFTVHEPGGFHFTGNTFDVAIAGDGFFVINTPEGPRYTRNGAFTVNQEGELQTMSGMSVSGGGGRIVIPPDAATVTIGQDGSIFANGSVVGQLQLVRFADPRQLERAGTTLFAAPPGVQPESGDVTVEQGYRELSNVNAVQAMVAMIAGMRQYEACDRTLRALSDAIAHNTNPNG